MTKIEEIEQKLNEWLKTVSKEEMIKILEEEGFEVIDKESKKEGKWKPTKEGEIYYCRTVTGVVKAWSYYNNQEHNYIIENQPIFKTKSECARYWHFMDTVKEKSYEFSKEEWEDTNIPKFYIETSIVNNTIYIDSLFRLKNFGMIYFKTEESAKYIIDNFSEELKEYWL